MTYRKIWQEHNNQSIPKGWHIHHVDGYHNNNDPGNLICVSPHVHWCIHLLQGDPVANNGKFVQGAAEAGRKGGKSGKGKKRKPLSKKHRRKIGAFHKDKTVSEEIRRKISESMKGKKRKPHSEETRRKISEGQKGKTLSEETRRKISEGQKGKTLSEETRRKISETMKRNRYS